MSLAAQGPIIYLITRGSAEDSNFDRASREILDIVLVAVEERLSLIQIREKRLSARSVFELARSAAEITHGSATRLLVNDRADIALAAGADGVHLAAKSIPLSVVRENFPPPFIIGVSTHTLEATETGANDGASFAVFAPVFETPGKGCAQGLTRLSAVCEKVRPFPVIALGGIDESNCESVLASGAGGIAAIRSLNDPDRMRAICRKLRK